MSFFEAIIMRKFVGDGFGREGADKSGVETPHSKTLSRVPCASLKFSGTWKGRFEAPFASITWSRFDGSPTLPRGTLSHSRKAPLSAECDCSGGVSRRVAGWY
jgi:hypothetical protein